MFVVWVSVCGQATGRALKVAESEYEGSTLAGWSHIVIFSWLEDIHSFLSKITFAFLRDLYEVGVNTDPSKTICRKRIRNVRLAAENAWEK